MRYKTILADPPWNERGAGKCKRGADRHYPLMTIEQIKTFFSDNVFSDDNCHLYLWVTNNHLKEGLELLEFLGFRYITNLVWIKDKFGLGQYFRGQHELCLFAVKGNMLSNSLKESSVINCRRTKHSQKPYELYRKIEAVSPPPLFRGFCAV